LFGVVDDYAKNKARQFYKTITDAPLYETTLENAELTKVLYNTMISTKIGFANVILEMCDKLENTDCDQVVGALKLSNRRLISTAYMKPSLGDGGACHPRDNIAMSWLSNELNLSYNIFDSIMLGREKQTDYLADIVIMKQKEHDLPVCILGKAFKKNTNMTAGSISILLKNLLYERRCHVTMYDPYVDGGYFDLTKRVYFIGTEHDAFKEYVFPQGSCVIDPFRFINEQPGVDLYSVGRSHDRSQKSHE